VHGEELTRVPPFLHGGQYAAVVGASVAGACVTVPVPEFVLQLYFGMIFLEFLFHLLYI
jgi:hypothetical protein